MALKFKDVLKLKYNLKGWFDGKTDLLPSVFLYSIGVVSADDLSRITLEKLGEGVAQSCCILLFLNDESESIHLLSAD